MNKDLVKSRFKKNLKTYDDNAKVQAKMANRLIRFLDSNRYNSILEIGCGTGLLTKKLVNQLSYETYIANDIVPDCDIYISDIADNIRFIDGDIETLLKNLNNKYDLIISNAAFQWIDNIEPFINNLYEKLQKCGIILFSTFGTENYREISNLTEKTLNYYSLRELQTILEPYSPQIDEEIRIMSFKTPLEMLKHIKLTGVNGITNTKWSKKNLKNFEDNYLSLCPTPTLTYHPIYVKITKL